MPLLWCAEMKKSVWHIIASGFLLSLFWASVCVRDIFVRHCVAFRDTHSHGRHYAQLRCGPQ